MTVMLQSGARGNCRSRRAAYRPHLERLEQRLPPGDARLGLLVAWPEAEFADPMRVEAGSTLRLTPDRTDSLVDNGYSVRTPTVQTDADESSNTDRAASVSERPTPLPTGRGSDDFRRLAQLSMPFHAVDYLAPGNPVRNDALSLFAAPSGVSTMASGTALPVPTAIPDTSAEKSSDIAENFGQLPLSFEQNVGQTYASVDFMARAGGYTAFLTPTGAVFSIQGSGDRGEGSALQNSEFRTQNLELKTQNSQLGVALHMEIVGANPNARAVGVSPLSGKVNYFIGNDPSQWHTNISTFGAVQYDDVYPGIDLVYYGKDQQLEYDFVVSPGADPNAITLSFAGADGMELDADGNLVLHTAAGDLVQQNPFTYQQIGETRQEVASAYEVNGEEIRFDVGTYDPARPLVIDPLVLGYSTYLGAAENSLTEYDFATGIAVDNNGQAIVTGATVLAQFPTTPGAFQTTYNGGSADGFVTKLTPDGSALAYSTFLGGSASDYGESIVVDSVGNAYVTGQTTSANFPTTQGVFDSTHNGGNQDAFVTKLSADGSDLIYSTFLGGSGSDRNCHIALDGGNAFISGLTESSDFPATPGAFDTTYNGGIWDGFVAKLSTDGGTLAYATFLGGADAEAAGEITVGDDGLWVPGFTESSNFPTTPGAFDTTYNGFGDGFVAKLSMDGGNLTFATFLGGSLSDGSGTIAEDGLGNIYVFGATGSVDFPVTLGAFDDTYNGGERDAFAAKLSANGSTLLYATFLGGTGSDSGVAGTVDSGGKAIVSGWAGQGFPTTADAFDMTFNGGFSDAFVTEVSADGSALGYSTYVGGSGDDIVDGMDVDGSGNVYVTGLTGSTNYPTTSGAFKRRNRGGEEAFITKLIKV